MTSARKTPAKKSRAKKKSTQAKPSKRGNLFIFTGSDEGRVRQATLECVERLSQSSGEFGLETIDGTSENSQDAARIIHLTVEAIQTLPFFGGEKTVWLKGANFLADNITGNSKTTLTALESLQNVLVSDLPLSVKVVISATNINKVRKFYREVSALAEVAIFDKPDMSRDGWVQQMEEYLAEEGERRGLKFDRASLHLMANLLGTETMQVENEMEKLDLFLGERRKVAIDDVRQITALNRGGVVFEIGNALCQRQLSRTIDLMDHLLHRGESAIGILLAAIVTKVRVLLQAKDLIERFRLPSSSFPAFDAAVRRLPEEELAGIPRKKDGSPSCYLIFLAARDARNFSMEELRTALEACLEANLRLVTTGLDPRLVLHQLAVQILSRSKGKRSGT